MIPGLHKIIFTCGIWGCGLVVTLLRHEHGGQHTGIWHLTT